MLSKFFQPLFLMLIFSFGCEAQDESAWVEGIRIDVNGKFVSGGEVIPVIMGESVQLKIEIQERSTKWIDVTSSPLTEYVSTTPWLLKISGDGLVTAPLEIPAEMLSPGNQIGSIVVTHAYTGAARRVGTVVFEVSRPEGSSSGKVLEVDTPKSTLQVGETIQLLVTKTLPDGKEVDLAEPSSDTTYFTTDEMVLVPHPDGKVTAIGTRGKPQEIAVIGVQNGDLYGSIILHVFAADPQPELVASIDGRELWEGQKTRVRVVRSATGEDVTSRASGTEYFVFAGYGRIGEGADVISIGEDGTINVGPSLGRFNKREVVILVRNGSSVGWTTLEVRRR